jgi:hypothetical protein
MELVNVIRKETMKAVNGKQGHRVRNRENNIIC